MILITGASGFIGQRLLKACFKQNESSVRLLSRKSHPNYETVVCDFKYEQIPANAFSNISIVYHLANYAHNLGATPKVDSLFRKVNLHSTVQLAELAAKYGVNHFIFVSSVKAGGPTIGSRCMTEEDQGIPLEIYGKTKREAELKLLEIGRQSGMYVSIVRPCLVYGPGVKGNLALMMNGIKKGWFPPIPEVGNRRSMIHVDDLVRALLLVANDERANGEIFIATDGLQHSSREIYETMCSVLGKSVPQWSVPKFLFDIAALIHPRMRFKIEKLLGDEFYSSAKLQSLGFKHQRKLREMNETVF